MKKKVTKDSPDSPTPSPSSVLSAKSSKQLDNFISEDGSKRTYSSSKQFDKFISEEEFDNLMSTEYRMTKIITPDLIEYDAELFLPEVEEGKTLRGRLPAHSKEEMIRACIIHTCTGSLTKTMHATKIPYATLLHWRSKTKWWPKIRAEVERIRNDLLVSKLDEVIEEATDQMLDRIRNGDEVYNHVTGEKARVKVKLTDLATGALKVAQEKRNELRGMEAMAKTQEDVVGHLRKLAGAFEEIAKGMGKQTKEEEPIDAEFRNVE